MLLDILKNLQSPAFFTQNVSDIIAQTHYSHSQFLKIFKQYTGIPIVQYISRLRIEYAAELLRGKEVLALRSDAPDLPEGTYYLVDVLGCEVFTEKGKSLGSIVDITPAKTDIYVVRGEDKTITFVAAEGVIEDIDVRQRRVVVNKKRFDEVAMYEQ